MIKFADIIVDVQAGDTGKGKIANTLAASRQYDMVLRYNGGGNAGHTLYINGQKIVTHQIPVGVFYGILSIIGPGCVVNLESLRKEIEEFENLGYNIRDHLLIDQRAHLVLNKHLDEDSLDLKIGTTKQGIGPAYKDKYGRTGVRMESLHNNEEWQSFITDIYLLLHKHSLIGPPYRILCEGAQGFHIDVDWGEYPYVTSSHCTVGSACLNGIPPHKIRKVIGTMKAYETYVGNKNTFTDNDNPNFIKLRELGQEYGATTGRPRKVRWLNIPDTVKAINVNGVTDLYINKLDILEQLGTYCITEHVHNTTICVESPTKEQFKHEVEYALLRQCPSLQTIIWSSTPY
jgi:adenylosuccinate synthase